MNYVKIKTPKTSTASNFTRKNIRNRCVLRDGWLHEYICWSVHNGNVSLQGRKCNCLSIVLLWLTTILEILLRHPLHILPLHPRSKFKHFAKKTRDISYKVCKGILEQIICFNWICRSQWPRGLRCRSTAARLLGLWVRIPPGAWMFVCCECCVLSGRGLCDELITRREESYRLWCVVVCDLENLMNEEPYPINVIELNIGDASLDVFPTCY